MNWNNLEIRNFLRNPCRVICAIFNWIGCVVRDLCIYIFSIIYLYGFWIFLISAIFNRFRRVVHYISSKIYCFWNFLISVKVHMLVAGETFQSHKTFIQKLKLQIKPCSAESSSVILLFCPVVSRIGTDMEAAMARVPVNKPVILVFMHHCHDPSHMTNITVQPSRSNIVQVVHCAFRENAGLLQCQENEQAFSEVRMMLQKYQQGNGPSTEETCKSV